MSETTFKRFEKTKEYARPADKIKVPSDSGAALLIFRFCVYRSGAVPGAIPDQIRDDRLGQQEAGHGDTQGAPAGTERRQAA